MNADWGNIDHYRHVALTSDTICEKMREESGERELDKEKERERDVSIICVIIYDDLALEAWNQRKEREREREMLMLMFIEHRKKFHQIKKRTVVSISKSICRGSIWAYFANNDNRIPIFLRLIGIRTSISESNSDSSWAVTALSNQQREYRKR